jgi:CHAT domain-containing protein
MKKNIIVILFLLLQSGAVLYAQHANRSNDATASIEEADRLIREGRLDEAENILTMLKNGEASLMGKERAILATGLGALYLNRGRNDLAMEHLQKGLAEWEAIGSSATLDATVTQSYLGNLYRATGKYAQAEEQLSIVLLTRKKLLPENDEQIAAALNDLGLVYSFSDPDKALLYYENALEIYERNHDAGDPKIAIARTNIGYLNAKLEFFGDAVNNFESALAIWRKVYPGAHPSKAFVLFNLGQTYEKMRDEKAARSYYEQALQIYQESYSGKHPDIARTYNALGNLDRADDKFTDALRNYQLAIRANHPTFKSDDILDNPGVNEYYDGNVLLYSMMYKAQALELNYIRRTLRFKDLLTAIRTLESCDSLIVRLRQQITNESDKITLGAIGNEVYADGVRISFLASQVAWKKRPFQERAFFFSEKSKAAVLLGAISDANAKAYAGIPAELLEEERQLKSAISLCSQKLSQKPAAEEERYLRQTFYELNRNYERFGKKLETEFPSYFNLKYNAASPEIGQLQQKLPDGHMVISYFIDDKNNRLYVFRITSSEYEVEEKDLPPDFDRYITGLRNGMYFSEITTYQRSAKELSSWLLPGKIPVAVKELIIIPTGRFSTIPFETLLLPAKSPTTTFKDLPYLMRRYAIRYEFSAGLILQKADRKTQDVPAILLCAPVSFSKNQAVADLPGTETEVRDISRIFSTYRYGSRILVGRDAHEQNLKDEDLKQYSFVHFATHGMVDESQPELSRIYLQSENDADDGSLFASEIYNLELNAQLVTLSACETGLGKISKGEGVIGLSRALVYAGARNCMVSFWKVADESTALLMKSYYDILLKQTPYNLSATLQRAKLDMLAHETYNSPFYWAPFILIGF